jgi:hypothetical protein
MPARRGAVESDGRSKPFRPGSDRLGIERAAAGAPATAPVGAATATGTAGAGGLLGAAGGGLALVGTAPATDGGPFAEATTAAAMSAKKIASKK